MDDALHLIGALAVGSAIAVGVAVWAHHRLVGRHQREPFRAVTDDDHYEPWDDADGDVPYTEAAPWIRPR